MVTKNTNKKPRRLFVCSYPGRPTATVNIVVENLKKAQQGRANVQRSLLYQYKKAASINKDTVLHWKLLTLEPHRAKQAKP